MKTKILIALLVILNVIFTIKIRSLNYQSNQLSNKVNLLNIDLNQSYNYLTLSLNNASQFTDIVLPDSLAGTFMLYIPEQGCSMCIDSAVIILNSFKQKNQNFRFFIVSSKNEYLNKYKRYHHLSADVIDSKELNNYVSNVTYPLFAYYTTSHKFKFIVPLLKENTKPFRHYLNTLELKKLQ